MDAVVDHKEGCGSHVSSRDKYPFLDNLRRFIYKTSGNYSGT